MYIGGPFGKCTEGLLKVDVYLTRAHHVRSAGLYTGVRTYGYDIHIYGTGPCRVRQGGREGCSRLPQVLHFCTHQLNNNTPTYCSHWTYYIKELWHTLSWSWVVDDDDWLSWARCQVSQAVLGIHSKTILIPHHSTIVPGPSRAQINNVKGQSS